MAAACALGTDIAPPAAEPAKTSGRQRAEDRGGEQAAEATRQAIVTGGGSGRWQGSLPLDQEPSIRGTSLTGPEDWPVRYVGTGLHGR
jgi:hypothetical protein